MMALCIQGLTSQSEEEKQQILDMLCNGDAGTNLMHESVNAMRQHFNHLQDDSFSDPYGGSPPNNVIPLATYRKDK